MNHELERLVGHYRTIYLPGLMKYLDFYEQMPNLEDAIRCAALAKNQVGT
jgi:hypothetical protein